MRWLLTSLARFLNIPVWCVWSWMNFPISVFPVRKKEGELDFCLHGRESSPKWPSPRWRGLPQRGRGSYFPQSILNSLLAILPASKNSELSRQSLCSLPYKQEGFLNEKSRCLQILFYQIESWLSKVEALRQGLSLPFTVLTPALLMTGHQLPTRTDVGLDATKVFFHAASQFWSTLFSPFLVWLLLKTYPSFHVRPDSCSLDIFPDCTSSRGVCFLPAPTPDITLYVSSHFQRAIVKVLYFVTNLLVVLTIFIRKALRLITSLSIGLIIYWFTNLTLLKLI